MAAQKRKDIDEDLVLTISENEGETCIVEEEAVSAHPKKKAKTVGKKSRKGKKESARAESVDPEVFLWGNSAHNHGDMDSEFEFQVDGTNDLHPEDLEGWCSEGAEKAMTGGGKKGVNLDEIIQRRQKGKKGEDGEAEVEAEGEGAATGDDEDGDALADLDLEDGDEGVLAEDCFGMSVAYDVEECEKDEKNEADDEQYGDAEGESDVDGDAASDDDSFATPKGHTEDEIYGSDDDKDEDAEEEARRKAFFAPDEQEKPHKKFTGPSSFQSMSLSRPILRGLTSFSFINPTPIQAKTIPIALMGKDVVGSAVTGSGKTAAFVVPILERLLYRPRKIPTSRVVILTPTRELAMQCHSVAVKLASHTDIKFCLAVGGLSLKVQENELRLRPDVIIATPGRFIDHMRNSISFSVDTVEILVLDEADRMLEDGFADELNEILNTIPKTRQTMLFSATMTSSVDNLIRAGLNKPVRLMVDAQKKMVSTLVQEFVRLRPGREEKRMGYLVYLCKKLYTERVIIFFRQKTMVHWTRIVFGLLGLKCAELHGSMNQAQRIEGVEAFRNGKANYLLATDLASRGLDIKGVDTVINYEAPQTLEIYLHRVGRTARAGRSGVAVTIAAEPDRKVVKAAVKTAKAQDAKVVSRAIEASDANHWQAQIDALNDEVEAIMQEEKAEKQLAKMEMQVRRGENILEHEKKIMARPKRTWFESEKDKQRAREAGRAELNGVRDQMKKKGRGKLSGKDRKKLDSKAERFEGKGWKKGTLERAGRGAVLNLKKEMKPAGQVRQTAAGGGKKKGAPAKKDVLGMKR